uniref:Growth arrest-specific protein 8 domain-containing protein n=1 Tax=Pinguiococcus pyrenoidosus TaxID=172671 RepID=A0A7R9UD54_9STRA|mmetsp:Transcript_6022/g.23400  ORF Transcript_6022/g.23400 Transcript_6022/m.23400 type:complete len:481 (+) Transcript_6022:121-1563(+)
MGPKKKGGKGGKKKGKKKTAEVEKSPEQIEIDNLREKITKLGNDRLREDRLFNDFQQQREKINYFWIVEKKKLEDKKAELRNKNREVQDLEERQAVEIKIYKQRVKHLLHEFQDEVTLEKTDGERAVKLAQDENRSAELELKADRRALRMELVGVNSSFDDYVKSMRKDQDRKSTMLRKDFERRAAEVNDIYEERMKTLREDLESQRKADLQSIEDQKDAHIERLMKAHERAFSEIKNYYNDITHNNLDLIKSLKEEVSEMKKTQQKEEKKLNEIKAENRRMKEPLRKAEEDVRRLETEVEKYEQEKQELRSVKGSLLTLEDAIGTLKWEHEVVTQRFQQASQERDLLDTKFKSTLHEVRQKSSFRSLLLERRLQALSVEMEEKEAQIYEFLQHTTANDELPQDVTAGSRKDVFQEKEAVEGDLRHELHRIDENYRQLLEAVSRKFAEHGIPMAELGFTPAQTVVGRVDDVRRVSKAERT